MPYTINKTNGARITAVQDGTIDTNSLSLTLVGKNYTGYGEIFNENFVKLLENFANSTSPTNALNGQIYYNTNSKTLRVRTGVGTDPWKTLAVLESTNSRPSGYNAGDLWWKQDEQRLYAYTGVGTNWTLIGPLTSRTAVSGALEATVLKATTGSETVLKLFANGSEASILSNVDVSVGVTDPSYANYNLIKQGITLPGTNGVGISYTSALGGYRLWGTAASASGLVDPITGLLVESDKFLLKTELATYSGNINIGSNDGILVGTQGVLKLHVTGSNAGNISVLSVGTEPPSLKINIGSENYNVLTISTGTNNDPRILPNSTATLYFGIDSQRIPFIFANTVTSGIVTATIVNASTIRDNGNRVITSVTVNAGTGLSGGGTITGPTGAVTLANTGVLSLTGTTNRVSVSSTTGNVTISLPQDLHTGATVAFNSLTAITINGTAVSDNGSRVITRATLAANAITTVTGTVNQITVTPGQPGTVVLSTPQNLHTTSTLQFGDLTLTNFRAVSTGSTVFGTWVLASGATFEATYADLAERYHADKEYQPGTVLIVGGEAEVTVTDKHGDIRRAGIVSTDPAFTMNQSAGSNATHPYIALAGRVPCQVVGPVTKGDLLVTSARPGFAERSTESDSPLAVIARALESIPDGESGIIEVMVV